MNEESVRRESRIMFERARVTEKTMSAKGDTKGKRKGRTRDGARETGENEMPEAEARGEIDREREKKKLNKQ